MGASDVGLEMDKASAHVGTVWLASVVFGLIGQGLFAWSGIGLNGGILAALVLLATVVIAKTMPQKIDRKVWLWAIPVVAGGIGLVLMDSGFLQTLNVAMILAGCGMIAFGAHQRIGDGALVSSMVALFGWILMAAEGCAVFFTTKAFRKPLSDQAKEKAKAIGRGAAIAVPLVLVFGMLLVNADPVFSRMLTPSFDVDMADLWVRGILFGSFTVFAAGLLTAVSGRSKIPAIGPPVEKDSLIGPTEFGVVFGSLSVLFGAFLAVQARYLFGGNDVVLATEGLTYAQYARRGFFELVIAAALAIPTVLSLLSLVRTQSDGQRRVVQGFGIAFLALVGALLGSAALRMGLYVEVYGLTELRFYTSAAMGWLGGAILILGFLVATRRQGRAGTWLVSTAMASVFMTTLVNPDRTIAVVNLSRPADTVQVDTEYLLSLGSGVVEPLFEEAEKDPTWKGQNLRATLIARYGSKGDFRSWTVSRENARRMVSQR